MRNFYSVLGVPPGTGRGQMDLRARDLLRKHHPDLGGDSSTYVQIAEASRVLRDPQERERYDARIRLQFVPCALCDGKGFRVVSISMRDTATRSCQGCKGAGFFTREGLPWR